MRELFRQLVWEDTTTTRRRKTKIDKRKLTTYDEETTSIARRGAYASAGVVFVRWSISSVVGSSRLFLLHYFFSVVQETFCFEPRTFVVASGFAYSVHPTRVWQDSARSVNGKSRHEVSAALETRDLRYYYIINEGKIIRISYAANRIVGR
jgi:hypothetical protein